MRKDREKLRVACERCGKLIVLRLDGCVILRNAFDFSLLDAEAQGEFITLPEFCSCDVSLVPELEEE